MTTPDLSAGAILMNRDGKDKLWYPTGRESLLYEEFGISGIDHESEVSGA